MGRIRTSSCSERARAARSGARRAASLVVLASALVACVGGGVPDTATEFPKVPRRPDGVVLEPPPPLPEPEGRASATGIVALREPFAEREVEEVVRAYVKGFERGDLSALLKLLAEDAGPLGRAGGRAGLVNLWRSKLQSFESLRSSSTELSRVSRAESYGYESLGEPGAPARPPEMRRGDVFVRVRVVTPQPTSDPLFGDVVILLLRPEGGRLKIAGQADESGS